MGRRKMQSSLLLLPLRHLLTHGGVSATSRPPTSPPVVKARHTP